MTNMIKSVEEAPIWKPTLPPSMRTVPGADQPAPLLFRQDKYPFPYFPPTMNAAVSIYLLPSMLFMIVIVKMFFDLLFRRQRIFPRVQRSAAERLHMNEGNLASVQNGESIAR